MPCCTQKQYKFTTMPAMKLFPYECINVRLFSALCSLFHAVHLIHLYMQLTAVTGITLHPRLAPHVHFAYRCKGALMYGRSAWNKNLAVQAAVLTSHHMKDMTSRLKRMGWTVVPHVLYAWNNTVCIAGDGIEKGGHLPVSSWLDNAWVRVLDVEEKKIAMVHTKDSHVLDMLVTEQRKNAALLEEVGVAEDQESMLAAWIAADRKDMNLVSTTINVLRNGGTSFQVKVEKNVKGLAAPVDGVYKVSAALHPDHDPEECIFESSDVKRVLPGYMTHCAVTEETGSWKFRHNAISGVMLDLGEGKYMVFEDTDAVSFTHHCKIVRYICNIGPAYVGMGYAVDEEGNILIPRYAETSYDRSLGYGSFWKPTLEQLDHLLNPIAEDRSNPLDLADDCPSDIMKPIANLERLAYFVC